MSLISGLLGRSSASSPSFLLSFPSKLRASFSFMVHTLLCAVVQINYQDEKVHPFSPISLLLTVMFRRQQVLLSQRPRSRRPSL